MEIIRSFSAGDLSVSSKFFEYTNENKPIKMLEYTNGEAELGGGREIEIADLPSNEKLVLIKNDKNYGFAEGNNIGMRYALKVLDPGYILLLNNDTIVDKKFLSELVSVALTDNNIGFVGPKIYYYDFQGRKDVISVAGIELFMGKGAFHRIGATEIDRGQYDETRSGRLPGRILSADQKTGLRQDRSSQWRLFRLLGGDGSMPARCESRLQIGICAKVQNMA